MKISNNVLAYHNANRYFNIFSKNGLLQKKEHIKNVIDLSEKIANFLNIKIDINFLKICAEHHDDGRVNQYQILGKFCDSEISHNVLSIDRIDKFLLSQDNIEIDDSISILRDVMLYHGRFNISDMSNNISKPYLEIVTAADDFENSCSCISYLLNEVETDAKGYIKSNPSANQKEVSDFVWKHFCNGEKFDKLKYCSTYAEYVLFAATLAMNCIKQYEEISKIALSQPAYGYSSIIEGYQDVFEKTLNHDMAKSAIQKISNLVYA